MRPAAPRPARGWRGASTLLPSAVRTKPMGVSSSILYYTNRLTGGIRMSMRAAVRRSIVPTLLAALFLCASAAAQTPALTGRVTSAAEGAMEGVLVSLKREGSSKTVTVVSHADGSYAFPRERLGPGRYAVSVRAVKFVLDKRDTAVDIAAGSTANLDLALRDANALEDRKSTRLNS